MKKESIHIKKTEILDRLEFIANSILNNSDGIIEILLARNIEYYDYYFYVVSDDKDNLFVRYAKVPSEFKYDRDLYKGCNKGKMKFGGCNDVLKVHLHNTYNSKITNTTTDDNYNDDKKHFFAYFPGLQSNVLSFGEITDNVDYIPFYNFINYLLLNVKVPQKMLFKCDNEEYKKTVRYLITELENELSEFMKKYESGRNYSLEIKLNKEWKKTDFKERANKIFSEMDNSDIIYTLMTTEYVYQIVDIGKYISPFSYDYDGIIYYHSKEIIDYFIDLYKQKNYLLSLGISEEYTNLLLDKTRIDYYLKLFLTVMPNDQIIKLSTMIPDVGNRFDLYSFFKQGEYIERPDSNELLNNTKKFEDSFNSVIIERGKNYYKEGRVKLKVIKNFEEYHSQVKGSEDNIYDIDISFSGDGKSLKYKCNCPCEFPCKHVYATLLEIDELNNMANFIYNKHLEKWEPIITSLSKEKDNDDEYKEEYYKLLDMVTKDIDDDIFGYPDFYKENVFTFIMDIINYEIKHFDENNKS